MDRVVTERNAKELKNATYNRDGDTASRILQEVGSCYWGELFRQAITGWGDQSVGLRVERSKDRETATIFKREDYGNQVDIAIVHDQPCREKK